MGSPQTRAVIIKEDRPDVLGGLTIKVKTGCGNMYVQLNWRHGRLFEVFATLGKSGGCASCLAEGVTRLITSALRSGMDIDECIDQIRGLRCPSPIVYPKKNQALSCPDAIATTMTKYGKLKVNEVFSLILEANDLGTEVPWPEDAEAEEAAKAVEELQEQRIKDGLYIKEDKPK